ncbi:hypothetical protein HDU79_006855 [Rhizoclosmatium sp. JEL0117]|nr:hypothetical protein HDU79_006855 [Rhizoclosmatium sp. JEL0117]
MAPTKDSSIGSNKRGRAASLSDDSAPAPKQRRTGKGSASATSVPATIPTVSKREDGVEWIAFTYEVKGASMQFEIRTDIDALDENDMDPEWKAANCVYAGATVPKAAYKGNRYNYETSVNTIGWKLCHINPELCGKKGLIQRAVDSFRNRFDELRSRRVLRQEKFLNGSLRQRALIKSDDSSSTGKPAADENTVAATPLYRNPTELRTPLVTPYLQDNEDDTNAYQFHTLQQQLQLQQLSPNLLLQAQQTPHLASSSSAAMTPLTPFDAAFVSKFLQPLTPLTPRPDSLIGRHLSNKLRQPKTLSIETILSAKVNKLRIHVDIERVDAILASGSTVGTNSSSSSSTTISSTTPMASTTSSDGLMATQAFVCSAGAEDGKDSIKRFASSQAFRRGNCVFPRALDGLSLFLERVQETGLSALYEYIRPDGAIGCDIEALTARFEYEVLMNEVSWRIAVLNRKGLTCEEYGGNGCKELLQRALDTYRGKFLS